MKKTKTVVLVLLTAALVLCVVAVGAYGTRTGTDSTPPVTTSTVAASYVGDVAFDLHATDASGVAYVYYKLDKSKTELTVVATDTVHTSVDVKVTTVEVGAQVHHPQLVALSVGTHTLSYWSQDVNGNVEARNTATFVVTPALTLVGGASSVRAGKAIKLSGTLKPAAAADIVLQAKGPGAKAFGPVATATSDAGGAYSFSYKTKIKGTWSFRSVYEDATKGLTGTSSVVKVRVK